MKCRKLLIILAIFNASMNTLYLVRFFGVFAPESVVYGYVPWFMSFALPNIVFSLIACGLYLNIWTNVTKQSIRWLIQTAVGGTPNSCLYFGA